MILLAVAGLARQGGPEATNGCTACQDFPNTLSRNERREKRFFGVACPDIRPKGPRSGLSPAADGDSTRGRHRKAP